MPGHPFTFEYIGLGLLDEGSIHRRGRTWVAEYRHTDGDPYMVVEVGSRLVRIDEFEGDRRVGRTQAPDLTRAIGQHSGNALEGERSRFWERVSDRTPSAWVELECRRVRFGFVPAMGIGVLCLPLPPDVPWQPPSPGPIARRIGLDTFDDTIQVRRATLVRYLGPKWLPMPEPIQLVKVSMPGILVSEAVGALLRAYGPIDSVEWRPFILAGLGGKVGLIWQRRPDRLGATEERMAAFSIVEAVEAKTDAPRCPGGRGPND